MSVIGGIQGLHFVNRMDNSMLMRDANKTKGIIGGLANNIKGLNVFGPLTAGAAIFGKISSDAYKFSKDYHKAMLEVKTISQTAQEDLQGVMDDIFELSTKTPQNAIELAKGYYQIVSAGYDGAEALDILSSSADLATSALTSTFTAADVLTSILNAYGDKAGDITSISDRLFEVVENGKTKLDEIAGSIVNVTGLASQAGLELNDLFAAYSVGTKTLKTEQFTTGMRGFLTAIVKPSKEALEYAQELGIEFNTTALKTKGLIGFLDDLQKTTKGNADALAKLFPNVEGLNGLLAMFADNGKEIVRQSENIEKASGNVKRSMATMMEDVDNKWLVVQNKWNKSLVDLGDNLKVASSGLADFLSAMLQGQGAINPEMFDYVGGMLNQVELLRTIGYSKAEAYTQAALMSKGQVADLLNDIYKDASEGKSDVQNRLDEILGIEDAKKRLKELEQLLIDLKTGEAFEIKIFDDTDPVIKQSKTITRANIYSDLIKNVNDAIKATEKLNEVQNLEGGGKDIIQQRLGYSERYYELLRQITEKQKELSDLNESPESNENLEQRLALAKEISEIEADLAGETTMQKLKPQKAKLETKEIKLQLKTNKELTDEQRKQLELQLKIIEAQQKRQQFNEDLTEGLRDASEILGVISYAIGEIDQDLSETVARMADLAWNASNLVTNLAKGGDPVTAIVSGIAMLGNIAGLFKGESDSEKLQRSLDRINQTLEIQGQLLANAQDENWFLIQAKQASTYEEIINSLTSTLRNLGIVTKEEYSEAYKLFNDLSDQLKFLRGITDDSGKAYSEFKNFGFGDISYSEFKNYWDAFKLPDFDFEAFKGLFVDSITEAWDLDEFLRAWVYGEVTLSDDAKDYLNQALEAQNRLEALINEGYSNKLGFDSDDVASTLRDGIIEGLNSTESAMYDWGSDFKDMLNQAILQSMVTGWLNPEIDKFMKVLDQYSDIEDTGEMFSEFEKGHLEAWYNLIHEGGQKKLEELGFLLDSGSSDISALKGQFTAASQESVSLLYGQITALRVDTKDMSVTIDEQLSVMVDALGYQKEIAENTRHNKHLPKLDSVISELAEIKSRLS